MALTPHHALGENLSMALEISAETQNRSNGPEQAVDLKLHDETIQALYGVSLRLQACLNVLDETPDALQCEIEAAMRTLDDVIVDLRDRIFVLTHRA